MILDIFSRVRRGLDDRSARERGLAERLIAETCAKQAIVPGQLKLHADRGGAMRSKPVALLLTDLGWSRRIAGRRPYVYPSAAESVL